MNSPQIHLQTREVVTAAHINMTLGVIGMMITALNVKQNNFADIESSIPQEGKSLPGEAIIAAENTFINACARLDAILTDSSRWDMQFQQQVEADYKKAMQLNLDYLEGQKQSVEETRKASAEIRAPHSRLNPTLVKLLTGDWAAFKGDFNTPHCIMGIGPNPEACLQAFDEAFAGRVTAYTQAWLEKHGVETNHERKMDRTTDRNSDQTPQPKQIGKRNRRRPGQAGEANNGQDISPEAGGA